eukprot:TCONS_00035348-protein
MDNAHCAHENTSRTSQENYFEAENQKLREENMRLRKSNHEQQIKILELENKLKILVLENENKVNIMKIENENQLKLQVLKNKQNNIEYTEPHSKSSEDAGELKRIKPVPYLTDKNLVDSVFIPKIDKMIWGVKRFFQKKSTTDFELYKSYGEWYSDLSILMENSAQYVTNQYVFIRKEFEFCHEALYFVSKIGECSYPATNDFVVTDINRKLLESTTFIILHPTQLVKCLELNWNYLGTGYQRWCTKCSSEDFYMGDKKSIICLGILVNDF